MKLIQDIFAIDCEEHCHKVEAFIREKMAELHRDGIVVAISGGLDSSTVVTLCGRAVSREKVVGLMLPEKNGNHQALVYAKKLAGSLGIKTATIDISKILDTLGTYDFIADRIGSRTIVKMVVNQIPTDARKDFFLAGIKGTRNSVVRRGMASVYSKHRIRLVVTYKYAEERNLLVVGCAHKSEDLVGLFSKFGVDDNADVMPLKNLYRSQILQIARCVGVPAEIIERKPNPDMLPGIEDKYLDVLGIKSETLDLLLYGLEHFLTCEDIADQLHLELAKVQEIQELIKLTSHMRNHSLSLVD